MKARLSVRSIILLSLLAFTLLVAALAAFASWRIRVVSYKDRQASLLDELQVIASGIEDNLRSGNPDPYDYVEIAYSLHRGDQWDFFYILQDSLHLVVAPTPLKDTVLVFQDKKTYFTGREEVILSALVEGERCCVVPCHLKDGNLQLLGIYKESSFFDDRRFAVNAFLLVLASMLVVLLAACWFWINPAVQRVVRRKNEAEQQLDIARKLQQKAVTQVFPDDSRADVYGTLVPMREIGGDVYRCIQQEDKLYFFIGDVSGKGSGAAFVMFLVSSFLHSRLHHGASLADLMSECNTVLFDNSEYDMFCTLFLACLDLNTLELTYCNAGHMKTLVNGEFLEKDSQLVCGAFPAYRYHTCSVKLQRGSCILLYTDGVTETRNADGAFFGTERLRNWAAGMPSSSTSRQVCESLLEELVTFRGKAEQNDDIAILSIKL